MECRRANLTFFSLAYSNRLSPGVSTLGQIGEVAQLVELGILGILWRGGSIPSHLRTVFIGSLIVKGYKPGASGRASLKHHHDK